MHVRFFITLLIVWVAIAFLQDKFQSNLSEKANELMQNGDYLGALVYYNYLSKTKPDIIYKISRINCLIMLKKFEQADRAITQLYQQQTINAEVYQLHARLLAVQGDTSMANEKYFQAMRIADNDSLRSAYAIQAAELNLYSKNFAKADSLLNGIHHPAFSGLSHYYRGVALRYLADELTQKDQEVTLQMAKNQLLQSIDIDSTFADNWFQLAMIEAWHKNADACLSALDKALSLDQNNLYYLLMKGNVYKSLKRCNEALTLYQTILDIHPRYELALEERAQLYEACLQNPQAAEADRLKLQNIRKLKK